MSNDDSINNEIINTAQQIGLPNTVDDIFDSQFIYWKSIQAHMRTGGYEAVKLRFPDISKDLAQEISNSDYHSLKRLCQGIISTLKPSVPEKTLIELLNENEEKNLIIYVPEKERNYAIGYGAKNKIMLLEKFEKVEFIVQISLQGRDFSVSIH